MAKKLSLQIKLEGGKEIKAELAEMSEAGQKAFSEISKAAKQAGGFEKLDPKKLAQVTAELKNVGVAAAELDKVSAAVEKATRTERMVGAIKAVENAFESLTSTVKLAALAFGPMGVLIGLVVGKAIELASAFTGATKAIQDIDKAAMQAGTNIEQFDRLRRGFESMGMSAAAVGSGIGTLQKNLEALDTARVKQAFEALQAGGGLGSSAMKALQAAAQGTGQAADDARVALAKLADTQQLKSLQADVASYEQALERARTALAKLDSVPDGTPGRAQEQRQLRAAVENATIALERAKEAVSSFTPQPVLTGVAATFEKLGVAAGDISQRAPELVAALQKLPDTAQRTAMALQLFGQEAGPELVQALRTGQVNVDQFVAGLTQGQANAANSAEQNTNRILAAWERFKQTGEMSQLGAAWTGYSNQVSAAVDTSIKQIDALIRKIGELNATAPAGSAAPGTSAGAPGFASGGLLGGRGTGTSDSNLAWVSRGEHIMPAAAVSQPGVLAFLEALRRSGGNLGHVLDGLGRFATGGPVTIPALASGSVGGMSNVTIQFPGLSPIGGLRASSQVIEELRRSAAMAQVRSGGRKPSRYT